MLLLIDYSLFLLKTITFVAAILVVFAGLIAIASKGKTKGKLIAKKCNEYYDNLANTLQAVVLSKKELKQYNKAVKEKKKGSHEPKRRIFILQFKGDLRASAVDLLSKEIDAILLIATVEDEVLVRLESPGGMVSGYGLAASQLARLRAKGISLTIAVDKVAASGGYMMAAVANRILAAPFAVIGSIGVIAQLPNFHRLLNKHHIDFEQITAGHHKRTLTVFGENTAEGRKKFQQELNDLHELFKEHIKTYRPHLDIEKLATGEYWFGQRALDLNLVDTLQTSDDYLLSQKEEYDLIEVRYKVKKHLGKRVSQTVSKILSESRDWLAGEEFNRY
ncbi:MAG: peptidase [Gammaproteobacteria bacterium]|jgi:serine protease SohB|nr:peptidase [Gammaproteobacteria bacterium]